MKSLSLLALLASASCSVLPRGRPQDVHVVLHAHKESSEASIEIFNKEHSALLLHSCASTLTSGPFKDHHIDFTVDENGAGSLAVGSKQYTIHHDAAKSGGIECDRIVNDVETLISCLVPLPYDIQLATKDNVSVSDCFTQAPAPVVLHHVRRGLLGNLSFPPELSFPPHRNGEGEKPPTRSLSLDRRQGQCWTSSSYSVRVGDGNPHQNPLNIQLSVCPMLTIIFLRLTRNRKQCNVAKPVVLLARATRCPLILASAPQLPYSVGLVVDLAWAGASVLATAIPALEILATTLPSGRAKPKRHTLCKTTRVEIATKTSGQLATPSSYGHQTMTTVVDSTTVSTDRTMFDRGVIDGSIPLAALVVLRFAAAQELKRDRT